MWASIKTTERTAVRKTRYTLELDSGTVDVRREAGLQGLCIKLHRGINNLSPEGDLTRFVKAPDGPIPDVMLKKARPLVFDISIKRPGIRQGSRHVHT